MFVVLGIYKNAYLQRIDIKFCSKSKKIESGNTGQNITA